MAEDYHRKLNDSQSAVQFLASEVDRLSRELTTANRSYHEKELAATEWKSKYETAQLGLGAVEQKMASARAKASEAKETIDGLQGDVDRLTRDQTSSVAALRDEIAALKNAVNQQKLEKAELEGIVLSQRYSEHPGNVASPPLDVVSERGVHRLSCFVSCLIVLVVSTPVLNPFFLICFKHVTRMGPDLFPNLVGGLFLLPTLSFPKLCIKAELTVVSRPIHFVTLFKRQSLTKL